MHSLRHFESTESGREVNWLYWLKLDLTVGAQADPPRFGYEAQSGELRNLSGDGNLAKSI
jgi:hypothetical protein